MSVGTKSTIAIRRADNRDEDAIWHIFQAVVEPGDTYAYPADLSRRDALALWMAPTAHTYVASDDHAIVGTYWIKANQPGRGSHVANAAFMVAPSARGRGVGRRMGEHCLEEARRLGFRAMQFNLVVSTNQPAVALWKTLGFDIIATVPEAFNHRTLGLVDAYVMYRSLL
jgi:ribosomal protein S18 acetylase RimI-like enzyme